MPDIFCHEEPQIQIKCLKSVNFFWEVHFSGIFLCFLIDLSFVLIHQVPNYWNGKGKRNSHSPYIQPHNRTHVFVAVHVSVDFLAASDIWNRPISFKDSQLKYRVDTLAFGCAFCYGIAIPCCLLFLYGKQHMVLEVNRTRTVTWWHWRWGCSFNFIPAKISSLVPRSLLGTRAICICGSMTFSAPRPKKYQGRTTSSCALWLQQHPHTSPCSIVDGCLGRASHVLESKLRSNPQKQFCYSVIVRRLYCSSRIIVTWGDARGKS